MTNLHDRNATRPLLSEAKIMACLSAVVDPSQGQDLVSLGLVSAVHVEDGHVRVILEAPPHRGVALEPIRIRAEAAIKDLEAVRSAQVILTSSTAGVSRDTPSTESDVPSAQVQAPQGQPPNTRAIETKVRHFIAIGSGKGGVGKSTTATNLAIALRLEGLRVGLLDADVYGPSQPRMLGVSGKPTAVGDERVAPLENYGVTLMSMGLLVPDETAMVWRGPMVQSALLQMLNSVAWGALDVMIIDLPPGTGDVQISIAQQLNLTGAIIVSTPQDIALLDVAKAATMFEKAKVPILGMIQNMSYWQCPDCGRQDHIFGEGGVAREARRRSVPLLGDLPLSISIRRGSDSGVPIIIAEPESLAAATYRTIAGKVRDCLPQMVEGKM